MEKDHTCCSSDGHHPKKKNFPVEQNRGQFSTTIYTNHLNVWWAFTKSDLSDVQRTLCFLFFWHETVLNSVT